MSTVKRISCVLLSMILSSLAAGCGGKTADPSDRAHQRELGEIYDSYAHYLKSNQKPPTQLSDLKPYEPINPTGLRGLQDGKYIVIWGVSATDGGTLLAYAKNAPTQGGAVLMADGTVKTMSAEDLKAALPRPK
jgi:hypothetical protein